MGHPLCRPDDVAARLLRGDVRAVHDQRSQVPGDGRRDERRVRRYPQDPAPGAGRRPGLAGPGRRAPDPDQVQPGADPARSQPPALRQCAARRRPARRAAVAPRATPARQHRRPSRRRAGAADPEEADHRAPRRAVDRSGDQQRHPVRLWLGRAGPERARHPGGTGAGAGRRAQRGARGGLHRQHPDRHLAVPVELGTVGGARGQRGPPVRRPGPAALAAVDDRLRPVPPARQQRHAGRPQRQPPRGAGDPGRFRRQQRSDAVGPRPFERRRRAGHFDPPAAAAAGNAGGSRAVPAIEGVN